MCVCVGGCVCVRVGVCACVCVCVCLSVCPLPTACLLGLVAETQLPNFFRKSSFESC